MHIHRDKYMAKTVCTLPPPALTPQKTNSKQSTTPRTNAVLNSESDQTLHKELRCLQGETNIKTTCFMVCSFTVVSDQDFRNQHSQYSHEHEIRQKNSC